MAPKDDRARLAGKAFAGWASALRFVHERPNSLVDAIRDARSGEWTTDIDGGRRRAALVWAYLFVIPNLVAAYMWAWQTARFPRFVTCATVELLLCTVLNQIPVVQWFIPDAFDMATWWPFYLLG